MKQLIRSVSRRFRADPRPPRTIERLRPYAMGGPRILEKLWRIGKDVVDRNIDGDFVECGVFNGGSAATIATALGDTNKKVWLYDSFAGLPKSGAHDEHETSGLTGQCVGSEEKVKAALQTAGFPLERCVIRKGWFKDTFCQELPPQVCLLHIDADWFESVDLALNTFYDRVTSGGIIVLDDFGHWEGCRRAFYEFAAKRQIHPLLERFGHTQAFWIKDRKHNREFIGRWEIP